MSKYDYLDYAKFKDFIDHLLQEHRGQFRAIIKEDQAFVKDLTAGFIDVADTAAGSVSIAVVTRLTSWVQLSGFPQEVQSAMKDLLFNGQKLFIDSTDNSLHTLKDSRATLRYLGVYVSADKRECSMSQRSHPVQFSISRRTLEPTAKRLTASAEPLALSKHRF